MDTDETPNPENEIIFIIDDVLKDGINYYDSIVKRSKTKQQMESYMGVKRALENANKQIVKLGIRNGLKSLKLYQKSIKDKLKTKQSTNQSFDVGLYRGYKGAISKIEELAWPLFEGKGFTKDFQKEFESEECSHSNWERVKMIEPHYIYEKGELVDENSLYSVKCLDCGAIGHEIVVPAGQGFEYSLLEDGNEVSIKWDSETITFDLEDCRNCGRKWSAWTPDTLEYCKSCDEIVCNHCKSEEDCEWCFTSGAVERKAAESFDDEDEGVCKLCGVRRATLNEACNPCRVKKGLRPYVFEKGYDDNMYCGSCKTKMKGYGEGHYCEKCDNPKITKMDLESFDADWDNAPYGSWDEAWSDDVSFPTDKKPDRLWLKNLSVIAVLAGAILVGKQTRK